MGWKALLWLIFFGVTRADLNLRGVWKENFGWEVSCTWQTWLNDTLQSVRMFRNDVQFVVYRPEKNGRYFTEEIPSREFHMSIECKLASPQGQRGTCVTKIKLYQNATEDTYKCEVSGERPQFRLEDKVYTVFVPPSDAVIKHIETEDSEARKILNCTSSGLPAPKLSWTIDGRKIPGDFTNTSWSGTTKLWHSWSTLNPQANNVLAMCAPEATTKSGQVEVGRPAEYVVTNTTSDGCSFNAQTILATLSVILAFVR